MEFTHPLETQQCPANVTISFTGTFDPADIDTVQVAAETTTGPVPFDGVAVQDGQFSVLRALSGLGPRTITATGFKDGSDDPVATATLHILIVTPNTSHFHPPTRSLAPLGDIAQLLEGAEQINPPFTFIHGGQQIWKLPAGQLFFSGPLELDTDGQKINGIRNLDPTNQSDTSLHNPDGTPLASNSIPFFVLPEHAHGRNFLGFLTDTLGMPEIKLGDIAAVIFQDRVAFAIFGDLGPSNKLGEGSIELHRLLGFERIRNNSLQDAGIDDNVLTIVFPGSGNGEGRTLDEINAIGRKLFSDLGGVI